MNVQTPLPPSSPSAVPSEVFQIGTKRFVPEMLIIGHETSGDRAHPAIYELARRGPLGITVNSIADNSRQFSLASLAAGLPPHCVLIIAHRQIYKVIAANGDRTFVLVENPQPRGAAQYWQFSGIPQYVSRSKIVSASEIFEPISAEDVQDTLLADVANDGELTAVLPREDFSSIDEVWVWVQKRKGV